MKYHCMFCHKKAVVRVYIGYETIAYLCLACGKTQRIESEHEHRKWRRTFVGELKRGEL